MWPGVVLATSLPCVPWLWKSVYHDSYPHDRFWWNFWHFDYNSQGTCFKLVVLVYWCLHGLEPWYFSDHLQLIVDSNRRRLQSSSSLQLVPLSTVGDSAFSVAGSRFWNSLPPDITSAPMLTVFRNRLKTYLFFQIISFITVNIILFLVLTPCIVVV